MPPRFLVLLHSNTSTHGSLPRPVPTSRIPKNINRPSPLLSTTHLVLPFLDHVLLAHMYGRVQSLPRDWGALDIRSLPLNTLFELLILSAPTSILPIHLFARGRRVLFEVPAWYRCCGGLTISLERSSLKHQFKVNIPRCSVVGGR